MIPRDTDDEIAENASSRRERYARRTVRADVHETDGRRWPGRDVQRAPDGSLAWTEPRSPGEQR